MLRFLARMLKQLMSAAGSVRAKRSLRSMRLCETLALGDRRYLALVVVEREKFLVGAAGSSISLLARFPAPPEPGEALAEIDPDAVFDPEEIKTWR